MKRTELDNVLGMQAKIRTFDLSVALYGYETWSFTLQDGHGPRVFAEKCAVEDIWAGEE